MGASQTRSNVTLKPARLRPAAEPPIHLPRTEDLRPDPHSSDPHIHVESPDGDLKVWFEPRIELAQNHGIAARSHQILRIVEERHVEIEKRWRDHHGS